MMSCLNITAGHTSIELNHCRQTFRQEAQPRVPFQQQEVSERRLGGAPSPPQILRPPVDLCYRDQGVVFQSLTLDPFVFVSPRTSWLQTCTVSSPGKETTRATL